MEIEPGLFFSLLNFLEFLKIFFYILFILYPLFYVFFLFLNWLIIFCSFAGSFVSFSYFFGIRLIFFFSSFPNLISFLLPIF